MWLQYGSSNQLSLNLPKWSSLKCRYCWLHERKIERLAWQLHCTKEQPVQLCAQLESGHYPRETNKDTAHFENLARRIITCM